MKFSEKVYHTCNLEPCTFTIFIFAYQNKFLYSVSPINLIYSFGQYKVVHDNVIIQISCLTALVKKPFESSWRLLQHKPNQNNNYLWFEEISCKTTANKIQNHSFLLPVILYLNRLPKNFIDKLPPGKMRECILRR